MPSSSKKSTRPFIDRQEMGDLLWRKGYERLFRAHSAPETSLRDIIIGRGEWATHEKSLGLSIHSESCKRWHPSCARGIAAIEMALALPLDLARTTVMDSYYAL